MRTFILALGALALSGCLFMPNVIVMRNPTTGEMVQCKGDGLAGRGAWDAETCARGYERSGWYRS